MISISFIVWCFHNVELQKENSFLGEPTFQADILPIFENSCSIEDCHDGIQPPDLRTYVKIYRNTNAIVLRLNDELYPMPPRDVPDIRYLEPGEKEMIIKWIQNGAPYN